MAKCDNLNCDKNYDGRCTSFFGCVNTTQPGNKKVRDKKAADDRKRREKTKKNGWW